MNKYQLINNVGCVMATVETTTIKKARAEFALNYEGNYKIICTTEEQDPINVRL